MLVATSKRSTRYRTGSRPVRDPWGTLRGSAGACGDDRSCDPIPVADRVRTDFLWQRSPFLLYGGGEGRIESAGIDFILPYWMARYYGVALGPVVASAASGAGTVAPDSIASLYGSDLPVPARVRITDASGSARDARVFFAASGQINFLIPAGVVPGQARISVLGPDGSERYAATAAIASIAPGLFSAGATGSGPAAAVALQSDRVGVSAALPVYRCSSPGTCVTVPLDLVTGRTVYVSLFGTGIRNARSVTATLAGERIAVQYAGAQPEFPGLDQINVVIDSTLRARGELDLVVSADGITSNPVQLLVR